ncbi:MAG: hypothetical protein U0R64_08620 [Candidatus Nanopelagicales bacterium]
MFGLRAARTVLGTALAALVLAGCGTASYSNEFRVAVATAPSPEPRPVPVAVFDTLMGDTADWARQHLGTSAPGQPYVTTVSTTATRWIGDNSLPTELRAGLYLPTYDKTGFYALDLKPVDATTTTIQAPYVTYDYSWETKGTPRPTGPPLPLTVTYAAGDSGWIIDISVPAKVYARMQTN